jgi:hypothetical protein
LATAGTTPKLLIVNPGKRLELLNDVRLGHPLQRRVAAKTPRKWSDRAKEIKTTDYLDCLFVGVL